VATEFPAGAPRFSTRTHVLMLPMEADTNVCAAQRRDGMDHSVTPYELRSDDGWTADIVAAVQSGDATVEASRVAGTVEVTLTAKCPRCGHSFSDTERRRGLVDRFAPMGRTPSFGPKEPIPATLRCACAEAHDGTPTGLSGCGATFGLEVQVD